MVIYNIVTYLFLFYLKYLIYKHEFQLYRTLTDKSSNYISESKDLINYYPTEIVIDRIMDVFRNWVNLYLKNLLNIINLI